MRLAIRTRFTLPLHDVLFVFYPVCGDEVNKIQIKAKIGMNEPYHTTAVSEGNVKVDRYHRGRW